VACKTDKPVPMDIGGRVNADMLYGASDFALAQHQSCS
jgi:hypothetical protein